MQVFEEYDRKQQKMENTLRVIAGQMRDLRVEHDALCRCLHRGGFVLSSQLSEEIPSKRDTRPGKLDNPDGSGKELVAVSKFASATEDQFSDTASSVLHQQLQKQLRPLQQKLPSRNQVQTEQKQQQRHQQSTRNLPHQARLQQRHPQQQFDTNEQHCIQPLGFSPALSQNDAQHNERLAKTISNDVSPTQSPRGNACSSTSLISPDFQVLSLNRTFPQSNGKKDAFLSSSGSPRAISQASAEKDLHELVTMLTSGAQSSQEQIQILKAIQQLLRRPGALHGWSGDEDPLLMAVQAGQAELARMLLRAQADPHVQDAQGVPLLHLSAFEGHQDITRLLLRARADANCTDCHGQTPIFFAPDSKVCKVLTDASADMTVLNTMGQSALHLAALAGLGEVFVWLSKRVDQSLFQLQDSSQATAMQYAYQKGLVNPDGQLISNGRASMQPSPMSRSFNDAKRPDDKSALMSKSLQDLKKLSEKLTPTKTPQDLPRKPNEKRRTIKTALLCRQAQADAAEDAQFRARTTLRQCSTMPLLDIHDELPMSPLGLPRFSPKEAAGPGRPQSVPRAKAPTTERSPQPPQPQSPQTTMLDGGVTCTSIPIPQQPAGKETRRRTYESIEAFYEDKSDSSTSPTGKRMSREEAAVVLQTAARAYLDSAEAYRVTVPISGDLGFRVVQHLGCPLTADRVNQNRKDLRPIKDGDIVLAVNGTPVANLGEYNKSVKLSHASGTMQLHLKRSPPLRRASSADSDEPPSASMVQVPSHTSDESGRRASGTAFSDLGVMEGDEVDDWAQLGVEASLPERLDEPQR